MPPVTGVSSFAAVAEGTYVDAKNAQLTTVSVLTPMWINFSISENEMQRLRNEVKAGRLRVPENRSFVVEIELVTGLRKRVHGDFIVIATGSDVTIAAEAVRATHAAGGRVRMSRRWRARGWGR